MCKGDAQLLAEGRTIPSCSMCSNSRLAIWRRSGASRRALEWTGWPEVGIQWEMSCTIGCVGRDDNLVIEGKEESMEW